MAPISRYLATGFFLISIAYCTPLPEEIAHEKEVFDAIQRFKGTITEDPYHVTDTWGGVNKNVKHESDTKKNTETETENENENETEREKNQETDDEDACSHKPGYKGKHHSSGKHSTVNYGELCGGED